MVNTQTGSVLPAVSQPLPCPHQECSVVVSAVHEGGGGGESGRITRVLRSEYTVPVYSASDREHLMVDSKALIVPAPQTQIL